MAVSWALGWAAGLNVYTGPLHVAWTSSHPGAWTSTLGHSMKQKGDTPSLFRSEPGNDVISLLLYSTGHAVTGLFHNGYSFVIYLFIYLLFLDILFLY